MASDHGVIFIEKLVGPAYETVASGAFVASALLLVGYLSTKKLSSSKDAIIPEEKFNSRNFFELLAVFIMNLGDSVMGRENRKYLPLIATLFVYLVVANLIGLVPGFSMPTDSLSFNLGLGLCVFVLYNYLGIRENGLVSYLKHFCGPVIFIAPLMFIIEIISHMVRPIALSLRLYGNMTGDHMVLAIFTDLTKFPIPVIFYGVGTFVCLMQAFVFTLLTMVYIRFAVAHEEHEHESHH